MNLSSYLHSHGSVKELSEATGAHPVLLSQWKTGKRPIPIERCLAIERATEGAVTRRDLRPDDWHLIWPELVTTDRPAPQSNEQEAA